MIATQWTCEHGVSRLRECDGCRARTEWKVEKGMRISGWVAGIAYVVAAILGVVA